ncbi:S-adenosyl-L-methionine-dependent methyltransferase [Hymenopellis radicata]|nr:S-adenosyl-L-methionine-dependent methyltransferase [Hymenopellis radicata]
MSAHHHHDFVDANKGHFDEHAASYDRASARELARRVGTAITHAYDFDDEETTVLDFACGTGLLSRELAPECKRILGVDISAGMVAQFNERVDNQGIPIEEMHALCVDLKGEENELEGETFDVAVSSMAYHHLVFPEETTKILVRYLKPGGWLIVADVRTKEGAALDKYADIVVHTEGFKEESMRDMFSAAGLASFSFSVVTSAKMDGVDVDVFLATGIKT